MANLDAMRRRFALDEEAPVEGGMSPTTTEEQLAQFATMDAQEEANAAGQGANVDDLRFAKRQKQREQEYLDAYGMPMETKPFVQVPPSIRSPGMKDDNRESFAAMAPMAERLMAARKQGLPPTGVDFASLQKTMSPGALASPIPVASAPVKADVPGAVKETIPPTTSTSPAPPAGTSLPVKPPPVDAGSGGDDEMGRLSMGQALVRALEGSGSVISGQNLRSGAADTLGERMKQIEALRAKREERVADVAQEQAQYEGANLATLTTQLAAFKDRPDIVAALQNLKPGAKYTKPSDFIKSAYQAVTNPPTVAKKEAEVPLVVARTGGATAAAAAVPKKLEQGDKKIAEAAAENLRRDAREWARIRAAANVAASKASAGQPEVVQKEVRATTQKLGDSVAKEYGEISSALKEADRSLVAIKNQPPDVFAKVMQATNLDGLNTPEERALFRSVGELRRAAQKAQSGLAVTENERAEFLQLFGANWLQSPSSLIEAIEWMRRKTKDKLDQSFATYRAQGSVGNTAVQAYREAGGVTPDAEFLLPFNERRAKAAAPKPGPAGAPVPAPVGATIQIRRKADGKTKTVPAADKAKWLANPDFEEVK